MVRQQTILTYWLIMASAYIGEDHHVGASFSRTEKEGVFPYRPDFPSFPNSRGPDVIPQEIKRDTYTLDHNFNPANSLIDVDTTVYKQKRRFCVILKT
jgi:hemoglobin/transferrin/lactoferrin receptor protein